MRVLLLTHRLPYEPNRGDRIRAYYLLREMARFAEVDLFSFVHDEEEVAKAPSMPFAAETVTVRVQRVRNAILGAAQLPSRRPLTHCLLDAAGASTELHALVQRRPPDILVAYCSGMARFAFEPFLVSTPLILDMVDVDSAKWADYAASSHIPRRWIYAREAATLRAFERRAARHARASLVVNERERQTLCGIAPDANVIVLPNGIDLSGFAPPEPPAPDPTVVFCGVMDYRPNEEGVLWFARNAWPRVRQSRSDARFLIVGARPTPAIRDLARLDASIEVTGSVPAVQPYLWKSSLAVAPLLLARGVQNKVLEALAAGLPVVATPAVMEGLPDVVRPGCDMRQSPDSFADAVVDLLGLPADRRRQRAAAARLDGLDWSECLRPIENIIASARQPSAHT